VSEWVCAIGVGTVVSVSWGTESVSGVVGSNRGMGVLDGSSWGVGVLNSSWGVLNGCWGVGHGSVVGDAGVCVSAGLVQGLLVSGVSGDGSDHGLLPEHWLLLEDGLGHVLGGDDWGGLNSLDGRWGVDVGGLSHRDGPSGQLWSDPCESVSLGGGVGKVAAQPVALNGG